MPLHKGQTRFLVRELSIIVSSIDLPPVSKSASSLLLFLVIARATNPFVLHLKLTRVYMDTSGLPIGVTPALSYGQVDSGRTNFSRRVKHCIQRGSGDQGVSWSSYC